MTFKQIMAVKFRAPHGLRLPPHITLYLPFKWNEDREEELSIALNDFAADQTSIQMKVKGFGCFPPRVIYVDPINNKALNLIFNNLIDFLQKEFDIYNFPFSKKAFNPHISIAHRDLDKNIFPRAWEEFKNKNYTREFIFSKISLFKHNGRKWEINDEFLLHANMS
ncbi:2'-5' RNA ligase family protein [Bacteroidota bacterium]